MPASPSLDLVPAALHGVRVDTIALPPPLVDTSTLSAGHLALSARCAVADEAHARQRVAMWAQHRYRRRTGLAHPAHALPHAEPRLPVKGTATKDLQPGERLPSSSVSSRSAKRTADAAIGCATAGKRHGAADEGSSGTFRPDDGVSSAPESHKGPPPEGSDERATESFAAAATVGGNEHSAKRTGDDTIGGAMAGERRGAAEGGSSGTFGPDDGVPSATGSNCEPSPERSDERATETLAASTTLGGDGREEARAPREVALGPGAYRVTPRWPNTAGTTEVGGTHQDDGSAASEASMVIVPDATLVEEEEARELVYGTPLEPPATPPLLEQQGARRVLGAGVLALIVLSIIIGVLLLPNDSTAPEVGVTWSSTRPAPSSSIVPTSSLPPSLQPSPPPVVAGEGLFETDCASCEPMTDVHGNTAVVTRDNIDIQFFSTTNASLGLVTQLGIDHKSMSLAINGNTSVIGDYSTDGSNGVVYIFERDWSGSWSPATRIQPSDLDAHYFGLSVALDGNLLVVSAWGTVYVYRRNASTWRQAAKLTPRDGDGTSNFGKRVAIQGTSIAVTNTDYQVDVGRVFVYAFDPSSNSWTPVGDPLTNDDCRDYFGSIVRLTDDAHLLVTCGRVWNLFSGTVYDYAREEMGGEYVLQQSIRFDSGVWSLDVENNAMVVSTFKFTNSNAVHFFDRQNEVWTVVAIIDEHAFDEGFGYRVRLSGNTTLISSEKNVYPVANEELELLRGERVSRGK